VIVGLNMGFRSLSVSATSIIDIEMVSRNPLYFFASFVFILDREKNVDIWRKCFWSRQGSTGLTATQQLVVVLPHHGPNSGLAKTNKASEREMNCHSSSSPFVLPHYTHE
jgi:hypothetical protein